MAAITFELLHRDADSAARVGRVTTPHGSFDTPAFMPVGTQGTIKGLLPRDVAGTGAQIVLGNTYHLLLRPGSERVAQMGGLQRWTGWGGPMLTDSGGFQVFSLGHINRIDEDGVTFRSHLNGDRIELTPERSMLTQQQLGADIIMAFDDCPPAATVKHNPRVDAASAVLPARAGADRGSRVEPEARSKGGAMTAQDYTDRLELACGRTDRWLQRCVTAHRESGAWDRQALFGIVQGGTDLELRSRCVQQVTRHDLPGYAIGGVAVGEGSDDIRRVVQHTAPLLPADRPRYLMGVGYERDIVAAVRGGVDMFDCVLPTRNGRNANAFTRTGPIRLKNAGYADDPRPIEEGCDCLACGGRFGGFGLGMSDFGSGGEDRHTSSRPDSDFRHPTSELPPGFSRSYLRHLFHAGEMLGGILVSLHNLRHFQRLQLDIRQAIRDNAWSDFARRWPVAFPPRSPPIDDR